MADTGYKYPTATHASSSVTNPNNAWVEDNTNYAVSSNNSAYGRYDGFSFSLPANVEILGIEVNCNAKEANANNDWEFDIRVSNDGGTSWSGIKTTAEPNTTDTDLTVGASDDDWSMDWTDVDFDTDFVVDVQWGTAGFNSGNLSLDSVSVKVYYEVSGPAPSVNDTLTVSEDVSIVCFPADSLINLDNVPGISVFY